MLRRFLEPYRPKPVPALWNAPSDMVHSAQAGHWLHLLANRVTRRNDYVGRLMTAVYADMVGYSRLFHLDDVGTIARVRNMHRRIKPALHRHHGRLLQTAGDSMLIVFDSLTEAVKYAVTLQLTSPMTMTAGPTTAECSYAWESTWAML